MRAARAARLSFLLQSILSMPSWFLQLNSLPEPMKLSEMIHRDSLTTAFCNAFSRSSSFFTNRVCVSRCAFKEVTWSANTSISSRICFWIWLPLMRYITETRKKQLQWTCAIQEQEIERWQEKSELFKGFSVHTSDINFKFASSFSLSCCRSRTFCSCISSNACPVNSISANTASSSYR